MGRATRPKPAFLAEKLLAIRTSFGFSQNELISRLGAAGDLTQAEISAFERGIREPPLPLLLRYAKLGGVCVDVLIDDNEKLPKRLPARATHKRAK